jgi:transcriptional regulator with XRE-family HTH domain
MQLKSIVATNVRQHRKTNGMTQSELADALNMSTDMVGKIERGYSAPSFVTLEMLGRVFNIPPGTLFSSEFKSDMVSERAKLLDQINMELVNQSDAELKKTLSLLKALGNP